MAKVKKTASKVTSIQKIEKAFESAKSELLNALTKEIQVCKKTAKKLKADLAKAAKNKKEAKSKQAALGKTTQPAKRQKLKAVYNEANRAVEEIKQEMVQVKYSMQQLSLQHKKYTEMMKLMDKFEKKWAKKKNIADKPKKAKEKKVKEKALKAKIKAKVKKLEKKKKSDVIMTETDTSSDFE